MLFLNDNFETIGNHFSIIFSYDMPIWSHEAYNEINI